MTAQDDFGSLGVLDEMESGIVLDVENHPAMPRQKSEKSLEDLELRSECLESSPMEYKEDALVELMILLSMHAMPTVRSAVRQDNVAMSLEPGNEALHITPAPESLGSLRPPRRYPRRFWIGLVNRMLRHQRLTNTSPFAMDCCKC